MSPRPLVLGHRGASARAPENTVRAFALAAELGADGVELDVRRTADDVLVVHHDPHVDEFGLIRDRAFAELRAAHPAVPTLPEALAACDSMLVNAEIKCLPWEPDPDTPERDVVQATIGVLRPIVDRVIVSSFDLAAVDAVRDLAPEFTTAWLTMGQSLDEAGEIVVEHGHKWLHPDRKSALQSSKATIDALHDQGVRVDVWTVDDPAESRALAALGVDAIVTNAPDVILAALRD